MGLNFVGANVVVLFDPTWNPANDLQAIDRSDLAQYWYFVFLKVLHLLDKKLKSDVSLLTCVFLFRAYRIGQCRDVTVLRLISLGTVEEIIYLRQVYKQVPDHCYLSVMHAQSLWE